MDSNKPTETKRAKISKAQRVTLVEVLAASLVLGACIVIANFLIKYIKFNTIVITAKSDAITEYDQTLRNVGVCVDSDRNGRLSDAEMAACNPNEVSLSQVQNSLRYNIYEVMAQNEALESVARQHEADGVCFDEEGELRNFAEEYNNATTDTEREQALLGTKSCSALRILADALPAHKNTEALMASLNDIFIISELEPESISPRDDIVKSSIEGIGVIPVLFRMEADGPMIIRVLNNIEKSIRDFDITVASFEWTNAGVSARVEANAYYLEDLLSPKVTVTVRAKNGRVTKGRE